MNTASIRHLAASLSLLLTGLLASCAGVQKAGAPAQPDRPEPGKGMVVFYRESSFVGMAVGFKVKEGGRAIGGLPNGSYFVTQAEPGLRTYTAATEATETATLTVEAGKTHYIRGSIKMGAFVGRPELLIVAPEEGVRAIAGLKRVALRE